MNSKPLHIIVFLIFAVYPFFLAAQPVYEMRNGFVTDCEGVLLDSEDGPEPGQYDHNEDYTFTVCVPGATEITINFDFFATEANYDILTIYDGPDKMSPILGTYSGIIQPPPALVANSGCVTFHFVSDDNIVAIGWSARWKVEIEEPEAPELSLDTIVECPMQGTIFTFDKPIDCSNFDPSNFQLIGPGGAAVTNVVPLDCDSTTNLASRFYIEFSPELSTAGNYRLVFNGSIQDVCGEWHDVSANTLFELKNCPIEVIIELVTLACQGECGEVRAVVMGSASTSYNYAWSHTPLNQQNVEVCTQDSILISVTVTDLESGQMVSSTYLYRALENPVINNPLDGDTLCASRGDHWYNVTIPGGQFFSSGIPNNTLRDNGRYQFWRWSNSGGLRMDVVTYVAPNGCQTTDEFYTLPINAGSIQAACQGSAPFMVNGGTPTGGTWSGPHVDASGMFDPTTEGSFVITYNAPNGCRRNKRVNVGPQIIMPDVDTICSSQRIDLNTVIPYGGRWRGPGITNSVLGRLEAWRPTPNQSYEYIYELNGCSDTMSIYIKQINAGPNRTVCDADSLLFLGRPGKWSGPGVYIDSINAFDISMLGTGKYNYTLEENGCTDRFELNIIIPELTEEKDLFYCYYNQWNDLSEKISLFPNWGNLNGPGVKDSMDQWWFNPQAAGPGTHPIALAALGCVDTLWVEVEAPAQIPDYEFCELSAATQLQANPPGGTWSGPGFLDPDAGLFDPQLLSVGDHYIFYRAPSGCITADTVEIFEFEQVEIMDVDQQYCYSDTLINITLEPPGGSFYINGQPSSAVFNPINFGEGNHELYYTKGAGACESSRKRFITVLAPISGDVSAANDSLCLGSSTEISINTSGGNGVISAQWDNGLGFGTSHIVSPEIPTTYTVSLTDGCSEPFDTSLMVYVYPEFSIGIQQGPEVCFEDTSWVRVTPPNNTDYRVEWQTTPRFTGNRYSGTPGIYSIVVRELFSGCVQEYDVELPGEDPLRANFTLIPNQDCIDIINNEVQIIDLAVGYTDGYIDFGDGSPPVSLLFGALNHEYKTFGEFVIRQVISNDLGCTDTISRIICVENVVRHLVPNVFTPDGNGRNDTYKVQVIGATGLRWSIWDRTGGLIFEADSEDDEWDGSFRGKAMNPNVFVVKIEYVDQETGLPQLHYETLTLIR